MAEDRLWLRLLSLQSLRHVVEVSKAGGEFVDHPGLAELLAAASVFDRARNEWLAPGPSGLQRLSIEGQPTELLPATPMSTESPLAWDDDFVYWASGPALFRRPRR